MSRDPEEIIYGNPWGECPNCGAALDHADILATLEASIERDNSVNARIEYPACPRCKNELELSIVISIRGGGR